MKSLFEVANHLLTPLIARGEFSVSKSEDQTSEWAAVVRFEKPDVEIAIVRERSIEWIEVSCKIRPGPRREFRTFSVGELTAYVEGKTEPYPCGDFASDAVRLLKHEQLFLSPEFLNSDKLYRWKVKASQKQFQTGPFRKKSHAKK